jgi:Zn-finger nucleic acid-binding protein
MIAGSRGQLWLRGPKPNFHMKKPTKSENQHVWLLEQQQRRQQLAVEQHATAESEKIRLKGLHWMHCPKCGHELVAERHGEVEVDLCPTCRGVWLDVDELEAIVARESGFTHACLNILQSPDHRVLGQPDPSQ